MQSSHYPSGAENLYKRVRLSMAVIIDSLPSGKNWERICSLMSPAGMPSSTAGAGYPNAGTLGSLVEHGG